MVEDKDNNKPSGNLKTEKSFLSRWSKKKAASKDIGNLTKVDSNNDEQNNQNNKTNEESEEEKLSIDELAKKYEVANPETLDSSVDLKELMQKKKPGGDMPSKGQQARDEPPPARHLSAPPPCVQIRPDVNE